jgi:dihydropteroate synthase
MWREAIVLPSTTLDGSRTYVMGVLNLTPDSFSDGGEHATLEAARARARAMVAEGADLIDVGGESTRPGAAPVPVDEELRRVLPVVRALAGDLPVPLSIDTYKSRVADAALEAGAQLVNDVAGGRLDDGMFAVCAAHDAPLIASHLRGEPRTMQESIAFDDVVSEVARELDLRLEAARRAGVRRLIADPGIGFGKRAEHNLALIAAAGDLSTRLGVPILIGASRKAFLGALAGGLPAGQRLHASVGAAAAAAMCGASIVRVHDVGATRQALAVVDAVRAARAAGAVA